MTPAVQARNLQRRVRLPRGWLQAVCAEIVPLAMAYPARRGAALARLAEVSVAVVSDATIARLHRDFMGVEGPTDVITFQHGEIVASADTAAREAARRGHPVERELALYLLHGMLHLQGWDDRTPAARRAMHALQGRLMRRLP